jgi:N6-adenosine-specific RNA methylase IME4
VILADPPYRYDFSVSSNRRVENHYPTMSLEAICALPVADVATDNAALFLWVPAPKLPQGLAVLTAWGFAYKTVAVWVKPSIGMGYYFRSRQEFLLVGVRGSGMVPSPDKRVDSVIAAARGRHSEKPGVVREIIERMYPGLPKLELFARKQAPGWVAWGNEVASPMGAA